MSEFEKEVEEIKGKCIQFLEEICDLFEKSSLPKLEQLKFLACIPATYIGALVIHTSHTENELIEFLSNTIKAQLFEARNE